MGRRIPIEILFNRLLRHAEDAVDVFSSPPPLPPQSTGELLFEKCIKKYFLNKKILLYFMFLLRAKDF